MRLLYYVSYICIIGPVTAISAFIANVRKLLLIARGACVGKHTYISPTAYVDTHKPGRVIIGDNCYITRNVVILCHTDTKRGGPLGIWNEGKEKRVFGTVRIGNNVFIGVNSVIMPGVTIGDNVIIGALSLVRSDIQTGVIAAGNPARFIGLTDDHVSR